MSDAEAALDLMSEIVEVRLPAPRSAAHEERASNVMARWEPRFPEGPLRVPVGVLGGWQADVLTPTALLGGTEASLLWPLTAAEGTLQPSTWSTLVPGN